MNFRSKMEANTYRYLTECNPNLKLVEYEPHLFTYTDKLPKGFNYLPDFRCTTHDNKQYYVEVKGYWDERSIKAIATMRKYRPDIKIQIVDAKRYARIKKQYARKIRGWEL